MFEDWIGEVGTLELSAAGDGAWTDVSFAAPVDDPVVIAMVQGRAGSEPVTLSVDEVGDTGFRIRLEEWDYLDGAHREEEVAWLAVSEGRHTLADGREIEAGATTLATSRGLEFADVALAPGTGRPVVLAQTQSDTQGALTTRLDDVTATGFSAALQQQEVGGAPVAATLGYIALWGAETVAGVTHAPTAHGLNGDALFAAMQTTNGADPATVSLGRNGDVLRVLEERSADAEVRHTGERVGLAAFDLGALRAAPVASADAEAGTVRLWSEIGFAEGAEVNVPSGEVWLLDTSAEVANITVNGTLRVADVDDISLVADWMLVDGGRFEVGSEADPFAHDFTLELTGDDPATDGIDPHHCENAAPCPVTGGTCHCSVQADGTEVANQTAFLIAVGEGAAIEIHGADAAKTSFTRLAATAAEGASEIRLETATGWEVGDRLAIASTDFESDETETRTVVALSPDGRTLTLDRPLEHTHFGELQTYSNGSRTWELDTRAEVALLTRNVTIQGDEGALSDGLGGHVMAMDGAEMRISGTEFWRMGQLGELGRYAVHWHMLGDAEGQYISASSVHQSVNRAVVIHGTDNIEVEAVVAHDVVGHAFYLEDGTETGTRFEGNIGLLTRAAAPELAVEPTDVTHVSTFWIANPDTDLIGNVAAGSEHSGFWFTARPEDATAPLGRFEGNAAHSNAFANLAFDGHVDPETGALVESDYMPERVPVILDFTSSHAADRAIWVRAGAMDFYDLRSADNARATFFSYNQTLVDSLIVGRSANGGTPDTPVEEAAGRSLPEPYNGRFFRGHSIYDGPTTLLNLHFAGFTAEDAAFQSNGAAQKSPEHAVAGLTFSDVDRAARVDFAPESWAAHMWSSGIRDLDGSLTGDAGSVVTPVLAQPDGPVSGFNAAPDARLEEKWSAWVIADAEIGLLRADTNAVHGTASPVTWVRSDGESVRDGGTFRTYHQTSALLNGDLSYRLQYDETPERLDLSLRFAGRGDAVTVEAPGVGAEAAVEGAREVADRAALVAATETSFLREGPHVLVRLVALMGEPDPRFVPNGGPSAGDDTGYIAGVRILPEAAGAPIVSDMPLAPGETRIDLGLADWTVYDRLEFGPDASGLQAFVERADGTRHALGRPDANGALDLTRTADAALVALDSLVLRSDVPADGRVTLEAAPLRTLPVHFAHLLPAGETFGIVEDAILGSQIGEGLSIVDVSPGQGGRVETGLPGQGGNVFFTADPGFAGLAWFSVTLADIRGRTAEATVSLEVVAG